MVTHQDLLNYHQPAYHRDAETWLEPPPADLRRARRRGRASSRSPSTPAPTCAPRSSCAPDRLRVVEIGVDHRLARAGAGAARAARRGAARRPVPALPRHRPAPQEPPVRARARCTRCARARLARARSSLAGTHAPRSSADRSARSPRPDCASVIDAGAVDEAEKAWLYAQRRRGRLPDRSTRASGWCRSRPPSTARRACSRRRPRCAETAARQRRTLVPWDAERERRRASLALLAPGPARDAHVARIRAVGGALHLGPHRAGARWRSTTRRSRSARPTSRAGSALEAEARRGHWEGMYWKLFNDVGPSRAGAGRPGRRAPEEPARRALAALAAPPAHAPPAARRAERARTVARSLSPRNLGAARAVASVDPLVDDPGQPARGAVAHVRARRSSWSTCTRRSGSRTGATRRSRSASLHPFSASSYDELHAVDDISFDVAQGEFFGIVGPQRLGQEHAAEVPGRDLQHRRAATSRSRAGCRRSSSSASASTPT